MKASWCQCNWCFNGKPLVTDRNAFKADFTPASPQVCYKQPDQATVPDVINSWARLAWAPVDWWVCNLRLSRSTICHSTPINHSDRRRLWARFSARENRVDVGHRGEYSYLRFAAPMIQDAQIVALNSVGPSMVTQDFWGRTDLTMISIWCKT